MPIVHDALDVLIDHFEPSDRTGPPFVVVLAQHEDRQLAVHFRHCKSPRYCLPFIVPEVWRFFEGAGKAIRDAESSIGANEFPQPLPITLIEAFDIEMQKP